MFPLRDRNPTLRTPLVTMAIVALNLAAWFLLQGAGGTRTLAVSLCHYALIPGELLGILASDTVVSVGPQTRCLLDGSGSWLTPVTSMFMHGGWFHLIGNMWFLWVFGDNVEDAMTRGRFVVFYLLCGFAAAAAQIATDPDSAIPMVGASGAIGGVMGAYARLYPRHRVDTLLFLGFYVTTIAVPAVLMLGYWFALQLLGGLPSLAASGGGVAFWAHIGGFLAGVVLVGPFRTRSLRELRR